MATLNGTDFTYIKRWIKGQPTIAADFTAWNLTKAQWMAAFQAVEDYMVGAFSTRPAGAMKAAIEVATGATTNARAQNVISAWVSWKLRSVLGG